MSKLILVQNNHFSRGSPICERLLKKIVEYFKNNVPQRQIAKALQISSSTVHNKSLCVRNKAEDLCWMPWSLGPQTTLHHSSALFCHWHYKMGPGILPETTVGKHNLPYHLQMPTKALSCKKEAICEHGPEAPSCPVGQGSFKMDCFKVEKCSMVRQVQIWHSCWKSQTSCPLG